MNHYTSSVSVVIPCYNLGEYLPEAVESVRQQSRLPLEIIIVDDGSTDAETLQVLRHYAELDPTTITVYHKANGGASAARNYGISRARGEYIFCFDADDIVLPTYLAESTARLDADPKLGIVATHIEYFGTRHGIWPPQDYRPHSLLWRNQIPGCAVFRKICWQQAGGYKDLKACQDWEFWLSIVEEHGWQWAVVPQALHRYRQRADSISAYRETHRAELLRQIVQLHPAIYNQHVAELFVGLDAELKQVTEQLEKQKQVNKAQAETILSLQKTLHDATQNESARRMSEIIRPQLPKSAIVLMVSMGDPDLLAMGGEKTWHFPQPVDGALPGHYPADSSEIIVQLMALHAKGADYLLIPQSSFGWLASSPAFQHYLDSTYPAIIRRAESCLLYDLRHPIEYHSFSVVIATYQRAAFLRKAIESVFNQRYPKDKVELIIIDNASPDDTAAVVQQAFVDAPIPCAYYVEPRNGLSYARNLGIAKARHEFVAQLDDDAIANPDWLAAFNRVINEQHALVVGGRVEKSFAPAFTPPPWYHSQYIKHFFGVNYRDRGKEEKVFRIRHPLYLSGGNTAYAKRVIEHFGGFRTDLGRNGQSLLAGEEGFLNLVLERNDIPLYYTDDAYIHHYVGPDRLNKTHLRRKALWSGITNAIVQPLFFGYAAVLPRTKENWADLRTKVLQVLTERGDPENFSRMCRILYHLAFLYTFYREYLKAWLGGRTAIDESLVQAYTPWTTAQWIDEILRWPDRRDKYEQLYQLYLTLEDADKAEMMLECLAAYPPQTSSPSSTLEWEWLEGPLRRLQYEQLLGRIRQAVAKVSPRHSKVAVISKGDEALIQLDGREGWHFPRDSRGNYAGYYPDDSAAAIVHLEELRAKGVTYLVLPSTALWWLEHYAGFDQYLRQHYSPVVQEKETCLIFDLHEPSEVAADAQQSNRPIAQMLSA